MTAVSDVSWMTWFLQMPKRFKRFFERLAYVNAFGEDAAITDVGMTELRQALSNTKIDR